MRRWGLALAVLWLLACAPPALAVNDPLRSRQWGLDMVEADAAHATSSGTGAIVAVIDTGAQLDHPDLGGRLIPGYDYIDQDGTPQDGNGHGTHVAGIVAANADNGVGVDSVAPGAQVLVVRVLGNDGSGNSDNAAAGIDYAVGRGAQVINLSFGADIPFASSGDSAFNAAVDRALDRGVVVVAAAGNSGLPICDQPSGQGRLLCVGAVDRRGNRSFFSNYDFGNALGITAPGGSALPSLGGPDEDILSTYPTNLNDCSDANGYCTLAGTSQASPHVAGVAALLVSLGLRGQAVTNRIMATARDAGSPGPDSTYGAGIVNARAAVAGLSQGSVTGGSAAPPPSSTMLGAAGRVSVARRLTIASVLSSGFRVRCTAAGRGRCKVVVRAGRKVIASASRAIRLGQTITVTAKLTRSGRALVARSKRLNVTVRVTLPGAAAQTRVVKLRR